MGSVPTGDTRGKSPRHCRFRDRPPVSPAERAIARAGDVAEEMARAWHRGERPGAEEFLARAADLAEHPHAAVLVVQEEVRLRQKFGPPPDAQELRQRFPNWEAELGPLLARLGPQRPTVQPTFPVCGEVFAGCRLLVELGRGAQGRVFLSRQPELADRPVVLKVTSCHGQEHLSLARLVHTHIVPLYFVQEFPARNLRALAMPYLGGATLFQLLDELREVPPAERTGQHLLDVLDRLQARLPVTVPDAGPARPLLARASYVEAVCWLGACLADGLQHAHERQLLHLDLKPSNVLLAGDGLPLLLDFHLARPPLLAGSPAPEWFGGTPPYMAPEQEEACEAVSEDRPLPAGVDGRSDLYSLGVVLYELLGGELDGRRPRGTGHLYPPLSRWNHQVSTGLSDIVARCLEWSPARRYQEAGALAADLRLHLANLPLRGVSNRSLLERWRKWRRRRPHALARAGLAAATAAALLIAAATVFVHFNGQRRTAESALEEGHDLLARHQPAEAERALARGLQSAEGLPGAADLVRRLVEEQRQARWEQAVQELGRVADGLRFLVSPDALTPAVARHFEGRCARLWEVRSTLLASPEPGKAPELEARARTDLFDLALLWADLRVRAVGKVDANQARRRALEVLDQAEALFGPGPVLDLERRLHGGTATSSPTTPAPRTAWEHYAVGRALLRAGQTEQAAEEFAAAVTEQPQGFWPNFYQGVCAHRLGLDVEAVSAFRVCIALAPEAAPCYYNRALALAALGQPGPALLDYDRALRLDPHLVPARLNRGLLHFQQGQFDQALADLNEALAQGADPAQVHYDLALVHQARHDRAAALKHVRTALRHNPDHAGARTLLRQLSGIRH